MKAKAYQKPEKTFRNIKNKQLNFNQVISAIIGFIKEAPDYHYKLSIGSDSQSRLNKSVMVSAIHVHRIGRGAIGFITYQKYNRKFNSLREKIFSETTQTLEIACMFTPEVMKALITPFLKTNSGEINFEFHLDIGKKGATRDLINEMVAIAKSTPFKPTIKPDSYTASTYADRHTKGVYRFKD